MFYPDAFSVKSILAKRCVCMHGRILRSTKRGLWTRQIIGTGQRNPRRNNSLKVIQTTTRVRLRDSPSGPARVSIHKHYTLLPPNKYFTCLTTFHLCGNSFLQSQRIRAFVTDHWSSGYTLVLSLMWPGLNLWLGTQGALQATEGWATEDQYLAFIKHLLCPGPVPGFSQPVPSLSLTAILQTICHYCPYGGPYSCLGRNPMDRGVWRPVIHGVTKSQTWLTQRQQSGKFKTNWEWMQCLRSCTQQVLEPGVRLRA